MSTFVINKNNAYEIYKMCCLYADHHKREVERLKWQNRVLESKRDVFIWYKIERGGDFGKRVKEITDWWLDGKKRYNTIADAYHLALHVASLYGKTTFPHHTFEEMHVNSVDMEVVMSYAYEHGNE